MLPLLSGAIPFGMLVGVAAVGSGITSVQVTVMSILLFAGASQFAAIDLLARDAPAAVVVFTVLVVPAVVVIDGSIAVSPGNERLLAAALATLGVGMAAFWGLRFLA